VKSDALKSRRGEWPYSLTAWASQGRPYKISITIHYSLFTIHSLLCSIGGSIGGSPAPPLRSDLGGIAPTAAPLHPCTTVLCSLFPVPCSLLVVDCWVGIL